MKPSKGSPKRSKFKENVRDSIPADRTEVAQWLKDKYDTPIEELEAALNSYREQKAILMFYDHLDDLVKNLPKALLKKSSNQIVEVLTNAVPKKLPDFDVLCELFQPIQNFVTSCNKVIIAIIQQRELPKQISAKLEGLTTVRDKLKKRYPPTKRKRTSSMVPITQDTDMASVPDERIFSQLVYRLTDYFRKSKESVDWRGLAKFLLFAKKEYQLPEFIHKNISEHCIESLKKRHIRWKCIDRHKFRKFIQNNPNSDPIKNRDT